MNSKTEREQNSPCQWRDSKDIYYIMDTLKLNYATEVGNVTVENLSAASLIDLINGQLPPIQSSSAIADNCITLSVCGLNWQTIGEKKRYKAIDSAATFRVLNSSSYQSQAHFKHPDLVLDQKSDELTDSLAEKGNKVIYNLSIKQFLGYLQAKNKKFSTLFDTKNSIGPKNFQRVFSPFEQLKIDESIARCAR